MSTDRAERLRRVIQEAGERSAQCRETISQSRAQLDKLRAGRPRLSPEQEREMAELYRSGGAGPAMARIQRRIDEGEFTWDDLDNGRVAPEIAREYNRAFPALPDQAVVQNLSSAMQSGLSFEEFLAQQRLDGQERPLPGQPQNERQDRWWGARPRWDRHEERDEDE
ncbi:hypothetical protein [Segniliparus rugosus]|uniref:Uncharacterized protein n=1 Tax=Segniliparus rugosus (strain ATCC BAA-974 / DSM 45345 / CCUG 50838 / CIP 108380 / JCM 13579 / CDC 945) TaxID=679197 RepID=E5XN49_SEGRC|nr:hypothetical protein [Segniliparus rugosus]EFV14226.1 hypothetical protein HMPREF9336_00919 [Segniliparus rugosus ATCC BAA-974]